MASALDGLLRDLRVDELAGDADAERVFVRGSIAQAGGQGRLAVEVACNPHQGSIIVRDPSASTQDLYPASRQFCDALVHGLRERDRSSRP